MIVFDVERIAPWVCEKTNSIWYGEGTAIGIEKDGELVGGVLYDQYTGSSICMHVASNGSRHWINKRFLWMVFDYPFNQLKVKKLVGLVDSTNTDALNFDKHLGFVEEAIIKDAGKECDLHILTMTRQQCRFLR